MSSKPEAWPGPQARELRGIVRSFRLQPAHSKLVGGSLVMLAGTILVSLLNFGYNIAVARMLGAGEFSHAAAAVTLLMLVFRLQLGFSMRFWSPRTRAA